MTPDRFQVTATDGVLSQDLLNQCGAALAYMVLKLAIGGTLTVRGNRFGFEAVWTPPVAEPLPDMPVIAAGDGGRDG